MYFNYLRCNSFRIKRNTIKINTIVFANKYKCIYSGCIYRQWLEFKEMGMNISKIGAKVVESYFNVFIGKGTQKMFINAEFRCAKENLLTQYKSVSVICHNTDKFWDYS